MQSSNNQRKAGVILSYVSIISNTLVQFIYTPFLIRMLGQSEYGLYSLAYSIIGYLTVLDLGFGNAIVVFTIKYRQLGRIEEEKKLHGMFKLIFYILGIFVFSLGLTVYFNTELFFDKTMTFDEIHKAKIMILILSFNLLLTFSFNIYSAIITAYERFIYQKLLSILNIVLKPVLMVPLLFLGYKSITMCVVMTLINLMVLISNYYYCKSKLKIKIKYLGFDKLMYKTIFSYSFYIFLTIIVDKVNWSADQFILGAVSGTAAVSLYAVAGHLNSLFVYLSTAVSGIMLPKMTKMITSNASDQEISDEFVKVGRIQYYIIFIMASGLCAFGRDFFILWAGEQYVTSYYISLILILPLCVELIQNLGISIMQAKNMNKFRSVLYFIIAIFNIIISIPLAKMYGGIGAAIGTSISIFVGNTIIINIYYQIKVKLDMRKFWKNILEMTLKLSIPVIIMMVLSYIYPLFGIKKILVYGCVYVLIYMIYSYFFVLNQYEKKLCDSFFGKILKNFVKDK